MFTGHARKICIRYCTVHMDHARKRIITPALNYLKRVEWESIYSSVRHVRKGCVGARASVTEKRVC